MALAIVLPRARDHHTRAGRPSLSTRPTVDHGVLTAREFTVALALAREREADTSTRSVSSATATVGRGTVSQSNTGHPCTSGTLLHIKVIGEFDIVHGALPEPSGNPEQAPVHAVLITADPRSGHACLIGVQVGKVTPDPGATVLFTH